tara:strand:+ start:19 stop:156 length:138 start_codon:yes stop_codon:yes gene_type:complete
MCRCFILVSSSVWFCLFGVLPVSEKEKKELLEAIIAFLKESKDFE